MSDLAERIRNRVADLERCSPDSREMALASLGDIVRKNAPTILAGLAALEERDKLRAACEAALAHVSELEDSWMRGCIREGDTTGGTRSNRNRDVRVQLCAALQPTPEQTKEKR